MYFKVTINFLLWSNLTKSCCPISRNLSIHKYLPIRGGQMRRRKEGRMVSIRGRRKSRSCCGGSRIEWELSRHCWRGRGPYSSCSRRRSSSGGTRLITAEFSMRSVRLKPWSSLFVMWWGRRWVSNRSRRGHGFVDWGWVIGAIKALRKQMEVISLKWLQNGLLQQPRCLWHPHPLTKMTSCWLQIQNRPTKAENGYCHIVFTIM